MSDNGRVDVKDDYRRAYSLMRYIVAKELDHYDCAPAKMEHRDIRSEMDKLSNEAIGAAWKAHNLNCGDYVPKGRYAELLATKPQKDYYVAMWAWESMSDKDRIAFKRQMERQYKKDYAKWISGIRERLGRTP